jgi:hypothetical protein
VNGLCAYNAGNIAIIRVDKHSLRQKGARVYPACGYKSHETFVVNIVNREADFIHVRGYHYYAGLFFRAFAQTYHISQRVNSDFVNKGSQEFYGKRADIFLASRHSVGFCDSFE